MLYQECPAEIAAAMHFPSQFINLKSKIANGLSEFLQGVTESQNGFSWKGL